MEQGLHVVLGASPRPERYANMAVKRMRRAGIELWAVGLRPGWIDDTPIHTVLPEGRTVHTVTLYVGATGLGSWMDRLLALKPGRIIFNPGTEHPAFAARSTALGVEVVEGCTLVMLSAGTY
jgi:predicted CoA-binding protein